MNFSFSFLDFVLYVRVGKLPGVGACFCSNLDLNKNALVLVFALYLWVIVFSAIVLVLEHSRWFVFVGYVS